MTDGERAAYFWTLADSADVTPGGKPRGDL
jgi:hypothetical protein